MKIAIKVLVLCLAFFYVLQIDGQSVEQGDGIDIKGFIELMINRLKEILPEKFMLPDFHIVLPEFVEEYISGTLDLSGISFSGLKEFEANVTYHPILPIPQGYLITVDGLIWNMGYVSDMILCKSKYLSLFGDGNATITLNKLRINGTLSVSILHMTAETVVDMDWEGITFDVSGLLRNETFSAQAGELVGNTATGIFENFKRPLSAVTTKIANALLKSVLSFHPPDTSSPGEVAKNK